MARIDRKAHGKEQGMAYLKVYTEKAVKDRYPNSLANSVHFAYSEDGKEYHPLNQGYGMLFAKAKICENNTIAERGVRNPGLTKRKDTYLIFAQPVDAQGNPVSGETCIVWRTKDFVEFDEQETVAWDEMLTEDDGQAESLPGSQAQDNTGQLTVAEIPDDILKRVKNRWLPLRSERVELPQNLCLKDMHELSGIQANVIYSDGSAAKKCVAWSENTLTALGDGRYRIKGSIKPVETGFPLAPGYADPVIFSWEGEWYFLATNDNVNDVGLFVRRAHTVDGLFAAGVKEYCILPYDESRGFCQTFWAPEFHVIGGELYILFAVSGKQWGPQCHMMRLKKGGQIVNAADWEEPIRVLRANQMPLTADGITLDMTYFQAGGKSYVCWSYRYGIGTPEDTGSMLYIATVGEKQPWVLTSEPVLLSRPLYGWENNSGTINNEGPYALLLDDKIYMAYSGGDACGYYYAVGYLTASAEDDLLNTQSWKKLTAPVLHSLSVPGIAGPGHNSFFRDEAGELMIAYHAQERDKYFKRCSAYHRVHIAGSGFPMLNVVREREVADNLREVELEFRTEQDLRFSVMTEH